MQRSAVISECGMFRYELSRRWDAGPLLEWVMLNPSTADGTLDDPTIRRVIGFAKRWGYGGIVVRNLYAYRATDPSALANAPDPIGPENRTYLRREDADLTVAAWGAHPAVVGWWSGYPYAWQRTVLQRDNGLWCLGTTKEGHPRHPLYVRGDTNPIRWLKDVAP